jgi:outer membrane assembly lipoprotein YfiO
MKIEFQKLLFIIITGSLLISCAGGGVPFPGLTRLEIYNIGAQAMQDEDWEEASKAFENILLTTGFEFAPEVRLEFARSKFERKQYIESRAEYQRALDRFPTDTTAPHADLGICRSLRGLSPIPHREQSFTRQALAQCGQVASEYAGTMIGLRASGIAIEMNDKLAEQDYLTGLHYLKRNLIDSAIIYFESVEVGYPESIWAPWALLKKIEAFELIGYKEDVEEARKKILDMYSDSEPAKLLDNGDR